MAICDPVPEAPSTAAVPRLWPRTQRGLYLPGYPPNREASECPFSIQLFKPAKIVHYVMADADYTKEGAYAGGNPPVQGAAAQTVPRHRPAMIVETWGNENQLDATKWTVNLVVFVDGMNDGYPSNTLWKTSVTHSEDPKAQGTWHWPAH